MPSIIDAKAAMLTKLAESGLDLQDAKKLGMLPCINGAALELTGYDYPGFKIPYFDAEGNQTDFYRFRIFGKTKNKYMQGKGTGVSVYFPPLIDWKARQSDPSKPIIITEGELKAACATKLDFPTIALGGVWSFKSKAKGQEFIPDLAAFEWQNRPTYICYDSDATTNPKVMQAECGLAKQLSNRGAKVYIVRLPTLPGLKKVGLDDYLMHRKAGSKKFLDLIKHAEEWSTSAALREFNNEVIFIFDPGVIVVRATDQRMEAHKAINVHFADRTYMKPAPTEKDAARKKEASIPAEWIKWPGRATAMRQTYAPGKERITDENEYNRWKGWGIPKSKIKRGTIAPWTALLDFIFKDQRTEDRKWFEQWCAYPMQNPGAKLLSSVIIWGRHHGTGKTLIAETLRRIYGNDNYQEIGDEHLEASFNDWAANKQFITGNEITGSDKRGRSNKLKNLITQVTVRINEKFVPAYNVPDCANYLWTANHGDAFYIEDTDRRFFVVHVQSEPLPNEFYEVYDKWYKSEKGMGALFYHFLHLNMDGFKPNAAAPMTESKQAVIDDSKSDMAAWVHDLPEHPRVHALMTSEELIQLATGEGKMNWTKNGLSRSLRQAGFKRPLGDAILLTLDDGKRVKPWLVKRELRPNPANQKVLRTLWYSDRTPAVKKFK